MKKKLKRYVERVRELENEGLTTSDAQGVADAEVIKGLTLSDTIQQNKKEYE